MLTLAPPEWNDEMEVHQLAYEVPYIYIQTYTCMYV